MGYSVPVDSPQPLVEPVPQPTAGDIENAAMRQAIAEKQLAEYAHCLKLALGALGPGWTPWMKIVLLESDYHLHRDKPPVVGGVVYKVYRGELRLSENSMFLLEGPDGTVLKDRNYEPLFGALLTELHPTRKLEIKGEQVPAPRWSVTWGALEMYIPKSAEELASLRVSRERGKAQRDQQKFEEENPLLAWLERNVPADLPSTENHPKAIV